ncbi:MAG: DUF4440 domain-containing protein [Vicinamibacterales bacterium]
MRRLSCGLVLAALAAACSSPPATVLDSPDEIIGLERAALERWGRGDPDGYLSIMAADVTYFDPTTERRIDGRAALRTLFDPIWGKVAIERSEMLNPAVVASDDTALLTFNLVSHGGQLADGPKADVRWNCSEIYRKIEGRWLIVHSHWSYTKPQVAQQGV